MYLLTLDQFDEYKAEFGQTLVCGYGRLGGHPIGVVANQRKRVRPAEGPLQFGGVLYVDSADKAARFIMDCNQTRVPLLFLQDVNGFMVGRDSEQAGIIKAGSIKLVNVIANSVVPKLTVILGSSLQAPAITPDAERHSTRDLSSPGRRRRCAVMGGEQAATTMLDVTLAALRSGRVTRPEAEEMKELRRKVEAGYNEQTDVRYAAARLWVDKIIAPDETPIGVS